MTIPDNHECYDALKLEFDFGKMILTGNYKIKMRETEYKHYI